MAKSPALMVLILIHGQPIGTLHCNRYSPLGPSSCVVMSMMAQMISRWYKALIITCDGDIYCPPSTSPAVIADVGELIDTQNHTLSQFE